MISFRIFLGFFVLSLFSSVIVKCGDIERKLSVTLNPNCTNSSDSTHMDKNCDDKITLVYIKSEASNDTIHYIWDFTGIPGVLIAKTSVNTTLNLNWKDFMDGKEDTISFSSNPYYVFSAILHRINLFDDPSDKANITDESVKDVISMNPHYFKWIRENLTMAESNSSVFLIMRAFMGKNGSVAMRLSAFADTNHGDELPHLYHSSQSMQIDLVAKNLTSNFTSPRIAVEFFFLTSELKNEGSFKFNKRRNLDDEFTPGIFDVFDIVSPRSNNDTRGAFFQYRPVCYITKDRTVSGSTELSQGKISDLIEKENDVDEKFKFTLPYSYYGYDLMTKVTQGMNITFGLEGDGFYRKTNYTSFSILMGIGGAPVEKLSPFVVVFAAIGLGVPLLVLSIGGIYVAIKRYR